MQIEIAQINTEVGNFDGNTQKIISRIKEAKERGSDLVVTPELAIPGYMSMDLMLYKEYLQANRQALKQIIQNSQGIGVIVGFIDYDEGKIGPDGTWIRYNSAALIDDGRLLGVEDKTLLPDYDVFYEKRYFAPGRKRSVYNFRGINLGIEICEDIWDENYPVKVSRDLAAQGADLLINISASPFYQGKRFAREEIIRKVVQKYQVPFIYANTVGVQDGYDGELVFDGQSMVFNSQGKLIKLGKAFEEDSIVFDFPLCQEVLKTPPYNPTAELYQALTFGIKEYFRRCHFQKAFIGLSGGIDSAVVTALAVDALSKEAITGISMPSQYSSQGSNDDARLLAKNLGINFRTIPIQGIFREFKDSLAREFAGRPEDVTEENLQARIRGAILMAEANKFGGLVLSTGNKTETALGYTTLYGDMCGGLAVISDVSKLKVYDLARYKNHIDGKAIIPQNTILKPPSAELKDDQTDEKGLGVNYDIISPLVDEIIEEGKCAAELCQKYPPEIVSRIINLINRNEYKRRQAPPGLKVTPKSFGIGRRIPISHNFKF